MEREVIRKNAPAQKGDEGKWKLGLIGGFITWGEKQKEGKRPQGHLTLVGWSGGTSDQWLSM